METEFLPPGNFGLPLVGELLEFAQDIEAFAEKRHAIHGPIFKTKLLNQPTVFAKGASANKFILSNENTFFRSNSLPSMQALLGDKSLSMQMGDLHAKRRRLIAQAFSPRALDTYLPTMSAITDKYLQEWAVTEQIVWYSEIRKYTFDVACKLLIGLDDVSSSELGQWFETWAKGLFSLFPKRVPFTAFDKACQCRQKILDALDEIIAARRAEQSSKKDVLSILIDAVDEDGERLSDDELKDQILMLIFAGHETLTSALTSFGQYLAENPAVKARARQEVCEFDFNQLSLRSLKGMTYVDQVIKESMRMNAPVGGGFRKVIEPCTIGEFTIPEGWLVIYSIDRTHKDSSIFEDPKVFNPERFSADSKHKKEPFEYLPFGGGLRECLGKEFARLEMKLFATKVLRNFDWELIPNQNLEISMLPTPHPKDGLKVKLSSLSRSSEKALV